MKVAVKLIVGLGNPGAVYRKTRHNIGFRVIDAVSQEAGAGHWSLGCQSLICPARVAERPVLLAKPLTFMNLSGRAVQLLLAEHHLGLPDLIVVLDDFNLPFGRIRIRERGSAGGHNGLESILGALENDEFVRVRVGVGEENMPEDKAQFVLSEFTQGREGEVDGLIVKARDAVKMTLSDGASHAMSSLNV